MKIFGGKDMKKIIFPITISIFMFQGCSDVDKIKSFFSSSDEKLETSMILDDKQKSSLCENSNTIKNISDSIKKNIISNFKEEYKTNAQNIASRIKIDFDKILAVKLDENSNEVECKAEVIVNIPQDLLKEIESNYINNVYDNNNGSFVYNANVGLYGNVGIGRQPNDTTFNDYAQKKTGFRLEDSNIFIKEFTYSVYSQDTKKIYFNKNNDDTDFLLTTAISSIMDERFNKNKQMTFTKSSIDVNASDDYYTNNIDNSSNDKYLKSTFLMMMGGPDYHDSVVVKINSKGKKIFCTSSMSICKTEKEVADYDDVSSEVFREGD